jgi:hypothetical protein
MQSERIFSYEMGAAAGTYLGLAVSVALSGCTPALADEPPPLDDAPAEVPVAIPAFDQYLQPGASALEGGGQVSVSVDPAAPIVAEPRTEVDDSWGHWIDAHSFPSLPEMGLGFLGLFGLAIYARRHHWPSRLIASIRRTPPGPPAAP